MTWNTEEMCKIAANEFNDGCYANLGIGMPTQVANYVPKDINVIFHSENGMLGMGGFPTPDQVDPDLINAGKQTITELPYSSYFDSATSFAMIRGHHIDITILGALQVSQSGDLANWTIPGKMVKGMGGAMDLVAGAKRVVVMMTHVTKTNSPKILKQCTLPLTGKSVVNRIITNLCVFDIINNQLQLVCKSDQISIDEIKEKTDVEFIC